MPAPISFQSGFTQSGPVPNLPRNKNLTQFAALPKPATADTVRFGGGEEKVCPHENCPHEAAKAQEAETDEIYQDSGIVKRFKVIPKAIGAMFEGGPWMTLKPFQGWKTDLVQSTVVTLPLTILPGSQLILIPAWMAVGALARSLWTLGKGMIYPDQVLHPKPKAGNSDT
jgi:hypothetical protein